GLLKPVARRGLLCFGPSRGQNVTFVRPAEWLGTWREADPEIALAELARRYLRAYGPATKNDFARWWGQWPGVGNTAWAALAKEVVPVTIEGSRVDVLGADVERLASVRAERSVRLLPSFDPYLMGHVSRDHLVTHEYLSSVRRPAGWTCTVLDSERP